MNQYWNPYSVINHAAQIEKEIKSKDYSVFTNDNTYSISINPYYSIFISPCSIENCLDFVTV